MKNLVLIIVLFISSVAFSQTNNNIKFKQGVQDYNNGDYLSAISLFTEIINNGEHSKQLYFNLGNTYYKLNDIPNSIYYYEKALKLDPSDIDTLNNLAYTQNMLIDKIDMLPSNQLSNILITISNLFSINQWLSIGIISFYIFLILFILYYFKRPVVCNKKSMSIHIIKFIVVSCYYFYIHL